MAAILIQPVDIKTKGGYDATLTGIDPVSSDCLVGTILTPGAGKVTAKWDLGGLCRDKDDSCNLNMNDDDLHDLKETAKHICGRI